MQSNKLQLSDMRFKITKMRTMKCQNYILFHKMKLSRYIFTVRLFFLITGSTSPPLALGKRPVSSSRLIRCGLTSNAACLQRSSLLHAWAGDDASPEPPHQWRATPSAASCRHACAGAPAATATAARRPDSAWASRWDKSHASSSCINRGISKLVAFKLLVQFHNPI